MKIDLTKEEDLLKYSKFMKTHKEDGIYEKKRFDLCMKYAKRDSNGKPIINHKTKSYEIVNRKLFNNEYEELNNEYKDLLNFYNTPIEIRIKTEMRKEKLKRILNGYK